MTSISKKTWSEAWAFQKKLLTFAPQIIEKYMGEYLHISDNLLASKRIYIIKGIGRALARTTTCPCLTGAGSFIP